jgi:hypothetical protein
VPTGSAAFLRGRGLGVRALLEQLLPCGTLAELFLYRHQITAPFVVTTWSIPSLRSGVPPTVSE